MDLQAAFDNTAKMLFGSPIGKLQDFEPYLSEMMLPYQMVPSCVSGKKVMLSNPYYSRDAKVVSQDELAQARMEPFSPNDIKDIDSLFRAASERAVFCGNKTFGRNSGISDLDNAVDCSCVHHAHNMRNVKYAAHCSHMRESEHVFGCTGFPKSFFSMRVWWGVGSNRCFESYYGVNLSETYYCFNCVDCSNVMFGFNLRAKHNMIGGLQLTRERYSQLRGKLVSEMADELRRKKRLFSVPDIACFGRKKSEIPPDEIALDSPVPPKVEQAFSSASKIVLGQGRSGIRKYSGWLSSRTLGFSRIKGAFGTPTYKISGMPFVSRIPSDRLATLSEAMEHSKKNPIAVGESESPSLQEMLSRVSKTAVFSLEFVGGVADNVVDTPGVFGGSNIYRMLDVTQGKDSAYTTTCIQSEHIFGGYLRILDSQFCINCFDLTKCKGCFEVDSSYSCRDSYFCHNCENVSDSMFCFNAKAMQYAVCNKVVGKEEFLRVKKLLLDYLNSQLDKSCEVKESVFSLR
jgi:hypothetical protein